MKDLTNKIIIFFIKVNVYFCNELVPYGLNLGIRCKSGTVPAAVKPDSIVVE